MYFDIEKILYLFEFDKYDPLLFTSSLFLFLFFIVLFLYRLVSPIKVLRVILLLVFSLFFYYKASGLFFLLLIFSSIINYSIAILIEKSKTEWRRIIFISGIIINIGLLFYFKYTNFFIEIINSFQEGSLEPLDILLPIGISFYTFKAISYLVEVYWETIPAERNFLVFNLYITFFANILAGPIDRAQVFLPQAKQEYHISKPELGLSLLLIISGLFKKVVIADYISINFVDRVFDNPLRFTGIENLLAVYGYALQIYCDFSGYSDMAIGIALLLGFRLMENFNAPYKANSVAEFWRRWHISLSSWLLDYLFRPLQMKFRNQRILGNASALLITFIICGFWHGASWTFIFWGFLHGFYMVFSLFTAKPRKFILNKLHLTNSKPYKVIQVIITFHLIAFAWIFFRALNFTNALDMLSQITGFFHSEVLMQFIEGYPVTIALIIIGFITHFIPKSFEGIAVKIFSETPLVGKAVILAIAIWIAAQAKSADLQPFLYFQF